MQGVQRIALPRRLDLGEVADGPAQSHQDLGLPEPRYRIKLRLDLRFEPPPLLRRHRVGAHEALGQSEGPEGARFPADIAPVPHLADLGAAAPDVEDDAVAQGDVVQGADGAVVGFALPVENPQVETDLVAHPPHEGASVGGVAHGAGRRRQHNLGPGALAEALEQPQGGDRPGRRRLVEPLLGHALAQAHHLADLVLQAVGIPGNGGDQDQAGGVGPEVDHRDVIGRSVHSGFVTFRDTGRAAPGQGPSKDVAERGFPCGRVPSGPAAPGKARPLHLAQVPEVRPGYSAVKDTGKSDQEVGILRNSQDSPHLPAPNGTEPVHRLSLLLPGNTLSFRQPYPNH